MPALTRERIIEMAVAMADDEGLEAVTLRRLAKELGCHVTSLYNHVPTRESITDGIVEVLIDEAQLPVAQVDWEDWVRRFFAAMEGLAVAHPGAFTALQRRPVQGPRAAASFEVALDAFIRAGLGREDAYHAIKATALTALAVGLERTLAVQGTAAETDMGKLSPDRFPQLRSLDDDTDPARAWTFSLETLVSGLAAQVALRRVGERATVQTE